MSLIEDIKIRLIGETVGFKELRDDINKVRNEQNALAREVEKGSEAYKKYKAEAARAREVLKLSDRELANYVINLKRQKQELDNFTNSKNKLTNATNQYGIRLGSVKSNLAQYSTQLVQVAQSTDEGSEAIGKQVGQLALFAGGWISVGAAVYMAADANRDWVNTQLESVPLMNEFVDAVNRMQVAIGTQRQGNEGSWEQGFLTPEDAEKQGFVINIPKQDAADIVKKVPKITGNSGIKRAAEEIVKKTKEELAQEVYIAALYNMGKFEAKSMRIDTKDSLLRQMNRENGLFSVAERQTPNLAPEQLNLNQTLDDVNTIYGSVSSTMSLLNVSTDSFVSKIITGFDSVLTIMQTIKTINSVFSFIPFLAEGGHFSGNTPIVVGERGPELLFPSQPGYIMNNTDSMRFASNPTINNQLYLNANVDIQASMSKQNKRYNYITVKR